MKISNAAVRLAMGGLAMGAGLVVARLLARGRGEGLSAPSEPPAPEQLIGAPQSHLSAIDAAEAFRSQGGTPDQPH